METEDICSMARKQKKTTVDDGNEGDTSNSEEDDRSYCCSSTSPQPIGDRLPILKSASFREHDLLINMGGEYHMFLYS